MLHTPSEPAIRIPEPISFLMGDHVSDTEGNAHVSHPVLSWNSSEAVQVQGFMLSQYKQEEVNIPMNHIVDHTYTLHSIRDNHCRDLTDSMTQIGFHYSHRMMSMTIRCAKMQVAPLHCPHLEKEGQKGCGRKISDGYHGLASYSAFSGDVERRRWLKEGRDFLWT